MEPENVNQKDNQKKILLAIFVTVLVVILGMLVIQTRSVNAPGTPTSVKEPTEAEKLLKAQVEELDRVRAQQQTQTVSTQDQIKKLDAIQTKQKTSAPKTLEQQIQELDAAR